MKSMLKSTTRLAAALALGAGACAAAMAADELGGLEFETVDADGDGQVVFLEIQAVAPRASRDAFTAFDTDGDEALDRAEYSAWVHDYVGRDPDEG